VRNKGMRLRSWQPTRHPSSTSPLFYTRGWFYAGLADVYILNRSMKGYACAREGGGGRGTQARVGEGTPPQACVHAYSLRPPPLACWGVPPASNTYVYVFDEGKHFKKRGAFLKKKCTGALSSVLPPSPHLFITGSRGICVYK